MEDKDRTTLASLVSGILFGIAWWLLGDAAGYASYTDDPQQVSGVFVLPGIGASIALLLLNVFSWGDLQGNSLDGEANSRKAKCCLFSSVIFMFASLVGAMWILIGIYSKKDHIANSTWPGVAIVLQTLLIILSAIALRFGRAQDNVI